MTTLTHSIKYREDFVGGAKLPVVHIGLASITSSTWRIIKPALIEIHATPSSWVAFDIM
jgi:hypothetical protein